MTDGGDDEVVVRTEAYVIGELVALRFSLGRSRVVLAYPPEGDGPRDLDTILDGLDELIERVGIELEFQEIVRNEGELDV